MPESTASFPISGRGLPGGDVIMWWNCSNSARAWSTVLPFTASVISDADAHVGIRMTLTAPACPAAQSLPVEVRDKAAKVPGVTGAKVEIVWEPPWTKDRMTDAAKLQLGML